MSLNGVAGTRELGIRWKDPKITFKGFQTELTAATEPMNSVSNNNQQPEHERGNKLLLYSGIGTTAPLGSLWELSSPGYSQKIESCQRWEGCIFVSEVQPENYGEAQSLLRDVPSCDISGCNSSAPCAPCQPVL